MLFVLFVLKWIFIAIAILFAIVALQRYVYHKRTGWKLGHKDFGFSLAMVLGALIISATLDLFDVGDSILFGTIVWAIYALSLIVMAIYVKSESKPKKSKYPESDYSTKR
jgi:uncharacterized membrane protein